MEQPKSPISVAEGVTPRRPRGIKFQQADLPKSEKEDRLRALYTKIDTSGETFDTKIATLYDPLFKAPAEYSSEGKIKNHEGYQVQSFIKITGNKLIKVSVYTTVTEERKRDVFEIAKQDVQNEVIYQELAGQLEGAPFSVPEILKFNYYEDDQIITLIEMQYIEGRRSPNHNEIDEVNDFLISHGIHHNDLNVDGNLIDISLFGKNIYNTGNIIVDADGNKWVIDFGSASDVKDKPRGGKTKRLRKSRITRKRKNNRRFFGTKRVHPRILSVNGNPRRRA